MANRHPLRALLITVFILIASIPAIAQQDTYEFKFAPDLWYNDVDGIRVGVRVLGEEAFQEGPHRIDAGVWLSTWLPELPVSYYLSITEPIPAITSFANEGSVQLISSIRTGYSMHRVRFNKRWQPGFDEYDYRELALFFSQEKMFDDEYEPYPLLWQDEWKSLIGMQFRYSTNQEFGQFLGSFDIKQNINSASGSFSIATIELRQRIDLTDKFKLRLRGFGGYGSENIAPEYRFLVSMNSPQNWLSNGVSRAKGTIPYSWLKAGFMQVGGGANMRGYLNSDINMLKIMSEDPYMYYPVFKSIQALNVEFEFPNFIDGWINEMDIIGKLTSLRSYVFFDVAKLDNSNFDPSNTPAVDIIIEYLSLVEQISDAGLGLQISFNIPDYLGKDRGIFIRYDVPLWLSNPEEGDPKFKYRNLIGVGAIFSF